MWSALPCVLVVAIAATRGVLAEPSCKDPSESDYEYYRCSNFSSPDDFSTYLERPQLRHDLTFVLKDSTLSHLPDRAFSQINATVLELSNVHLETFSLPGENPFDGMQSSLKKIILSHGSTIPTSWAVFSSLEQLKTVRISEAQNLVLAQSFNELPQTVKVINIAFSDIASVDEDWVSSLQNLEVVGIRHCNLKVFLRSMLPRPAPKLWRLDLYRNNLTSLPSDFSADMPVLRSVTVEHNQITTLSRETFAPLADNEENSVRLTGNPLRCDCNLRFALSYPPSWLGAACETPEQLNGRLLKDLTEEQLTCADGA
uniref:Putative toll-like receptor 5 n=1 Tax=Amblyomma americanum TaxID=6943 RepID=A0A0C9SEH4_AMBAM